MIKKSILYVSDRCENGVIRLFHLLNFLMWLHLCDRYECLQQVLPQSANVSHSGHIWVDIPTPNRSQLHVRSKDLMYQQNDGFIANYETIEWSPLMGLKRIGPKFPNNLPLTGSEILGMEGSSQGKEMLNRMACFQRLIQGDAKNGNLPYFIRI